MSETTKAEPVFTQKMTMHLNGGSKFSELHYRVYVDEKETGITHHRRTNGSPKYVIIEDFFACGDDRFDNLAVKGVGLKEWLTAHVLHVADDDHAKPEDV